MPVNFGLYFFSRCIALIVRTQALSEDLTLVDDNKKNMVVLEFQDEWLVQKLRMKCGSEKKGWYNTLIDIVIVDL